jgi:hypothetical protein
MARRSCGCSCLERGYRNPSISRQDASARSCCGAPATRAALYRASGLVQRPLSDGSRAAIASNWTLRRPTHHIAAAGAAADPRNPLSLSSYTQRHTGGAAADLLKRRGVLIIQNFPGKDRDASRRIQKRLFPRGKTVGLIGSGGIGIRIAVYLASAGMSPRGEQALEAFKSEAIALDLQFF